MKQTIGLCIILLIAIALTLGIGVRDVTLMDMLQAFIAFDPTNPVHVVIHSVRTPRLVAALVAGAGLGMAGTVIQSLTRNPLADPGILGVNSGAAFAVVVGALLTGRSDSGWMSAMAFPGAALAAISVFMLGGGARGQAGPVRLALAGTALNALLLSLVSAIVLARNETLEIFRFWVTGSLAQADVRPLAGMSVTAAIGAALALLLAPRIEALSLGSALARGLGTKPARIQFGALLAVTLMTGSAVAVAGPIAFLGLLVPPLARRVAGHALRRELLASAVIGASILLYADTAGRLILAPSEIRVGIMTALIGAPMFIFIARRLRPGAST
ncbi:FecCD family ABC transporter permease [Neorhizobium alkalisoli]|uniref:Iron complex transport system permease protein n=1 Tax=Neorhizobium alkalisoli TaxID=528178 RepID=A0A561R6R7_9HYPH|nr:iron ABC transporter permease [Neorhizobium alkalisoli]TWF58296.1 iron complex transport system permease protein [Neorhizobium alkalisoli]